MKVTILGTGAYGLALGLMFNKNIKNITMWTKFEQEKEMLDKKRKNDKVLPNVKMPENINFTTNLEEAVKNANALLLLTEWNEFRRPDFEKIKTLMTAPLIFDGRNQYNAERLKDKGFVYYQIGRVV